MKDPPANELDEELLELIALQVPWYMVCGEFHQRYGSAGALARRLFELREAGLLEIRSRSGEAVDLTPEAMEADALENDCYEEIESVREPRWDIIATDVGFSSIETRLGKQ